MKEAQEETLYGDDSSLLEISPWNLKFPIVATKFH